MIRLLFWLVIGTLLVAALRKLGSAGRRPGVGAPAVAENMVRCCVCGLNLPQSEARRVGAADAAAVRWACGAQHARDADAGAT